MRSYRGLTKDGEWVYGYYIVLGSHHLIADEGTDWDSAGEPGVIEIEGLIEVIPASVAQQVGIKDKEGKEIYEGDIVIIQKEFGEYQSDFLPPTKTVAKLYGYSGEFCFDDDFVSMGNTYQNGRVIIGNICQNPKLLENPK